MANDKNKPKRHQGWKAEELLLPVSAFPKFDAICDNAGKVDKVQFDKMLKWLYEWARDMSAWGQDMRDDLIRLEGQAGFASGDPGDPPGGPPE